MFGGFASAGDGSNATPVLSFGHPGSRRSFLEQKARLTDSPDLRSLTLSSSPIEGLKGAAAAAQQQRSPLADAHGGSDQLQGTAGRISKSLNITVDEAQELCGCACPSAALALLLRLPPSALPGVQ
jgi:hypothetical protein